MSMVLAFNLQGETPKVRTPGIAGKRPSWIELGPEGWHSRNQADALDRLPERGCAKVVLGVVRKEPSSYGKRDLAIAYEEAVKAQSGRIYSIKKANRRKLRHAFMTRANANGGIRSLFNELDADGDGSITLKEFYMGLQKLGLGLTLTRDEVAEIHREMDLNNDSVVDLDEISNFVGSLRVGKKTKGKHPGPIISDRDRRKLTTTVFDPRVKVFKPRRGDWTRDRGRRTIQKLLQSKLVGPSAVYQEGIPTSYGEPNFRPVPRNYHQ
jgi:hypothetical protein